MIQPVDSSVILSNKAKVLNLTFCAAPTVYENNYSPAGQKLNVTSFGCEKPKGCGEKLDKIV